MSDRKRVKLKICGMEYVIMSDESEAYVKELGDAIDRSMRNLMSTDPRISTTMASIMTALNLADEARKASASADNLRSQLKDYLKDNAKAHNDADAARKETQELRAEMDKLKRQYVPGYKKPDNK